MNLEVALPIARQVRDRLAPYCDRVEIAGSIRRKKPEVGDVEIVAIRKRGGINLLGLVDEINYWSKVKGEATGKYTQRRLPEGINLDLFFTTADNWGLTFAVRTGSAEFSHRVLAKGWVSRGYHGVDGRLVRKINPDKPGFDGPPIPIPEEQDLFDLLGISFIAPENRG